MSRENGEGNKQAAHPDLRGDAQRAVSTGRALGGGASGQPERVMQEAIAAAEEVLQLEESKQYLNIADEYQPFNSFESKSYDDLVKEGLMNAKEAGLLVAIDKQISQLKETIGAAKADVAVVHGIDLKKEALNKLELAKSQFEEALAKRVGFDKAGLMVYQNRMRSELGEYLKQAESEIARRLVGVNSLSVSVAQQIVEPGKKTGGEGEKRKRAETYLKKEVKPIVESILRAQQAAMGIIERAIGQKAIADLKTATRKIDQLEGMETLTDQQKTEKGGLQQEREEKVRRFTQALDTKFSEGLKVVDLRPDLTQSAGVVGENKSYVQKIKLLIGDQVEKALRLLSGGSKDDQALVKEVETKRYQIIVDHRILEELTAPELQRISAEVATRRATKAEKRR